MEKKLLTHKEAVKLLRDYRKQKKLSMSEHAEKLGVSKQHLRAVDLGLMLPNEKFGFKKIVKFEPMFQLVGGSR